MAKEIVGAAPSSGEVLVKDTVTGDLSWEPATPEQVSSTMVALAAVPEGAAITPIEYKAPSPGTALIVPPLLAAAAVTAAGLLAAGPPGWLIDLTLAGFTLTWLYQSGALTSINDAIRYLIGSLQQTSASDIITAERQFLTEHQIDLAQLAQTQTATQAAQQQALIDRALLAGEQASAIYIEGTAAGLAESDIEARIRAGGLTAGLTLEQTDVFTKAALEWEAKVRAAEVAKAAAAEKAAASAVATTAAIAGAAVPGLGTTAMAGALSAAGLAALIPTLANSFAKSSHSQSIACMSSTGAALLQGVLQTALPAAAASLFMVSPAIQETISGFANKVVSVFTAPMEREAPITPEKAPGVGAYLLSQAVLMGAGAHLTSITAEASAPLKNMGLGYLAAFMADMAGFSRIAAAFQGQMINWGLMQPMRYYSLEKFRPMIPSERDLGALASEYMLASPDSVKKCIDGLISFADLDMENQAAYMELMKYHGYQDKDITRMYQQVDTPMRYFALSAVARAGMFDPMFFRDELRNSGYSPLACDRLYAAFEKETLESARGAMSGAVTKPFRLGLLSDDGLTGHLESLGYSLDQAKPILYAARLDFATEQAEDSKALYIDQFKKGLIDEDDLAVAISCLGYRPEVVNLEVQKAITSVTPKVAKEEPPENKALMRDIQKKYIDSYLYLYRKDYIDEDKLFNYLVELNIVPGLARATVTLEAARKLPKALVEVV